MGHNMRLFSAIPGLINTIRLYRNFHYQHFGNKPPNPKPGTFGSNLCQHVVAFWVAMDVGGLFCFGYCNAVEHLGIGRLGNIASRPFCVPLAYFVCCSNHFLCLD